MDKSGIVIYWSTHPALVPDNAANKRWLSMYLFSMEAFGMTNFHVIGSPGITHGYKVQHQEHDSLQDVFDLYDDIQVVASVGRDFPGISVQNLSDFQHRNCPCNQAGCYNYR